MLVMSIALARAPHAKAAGRLSRDGVRTDALRHQVKPGMTGRARVNGWRGRTDTELKIRRRVQFDLDYIRS